MAGDVNYGNVVLLLHCDGTNGSTTIVDSSFVPKIATAYGNAQISTAQSKFGGASLYLDGTGDFVDFASRADFGFGTADFTIEYWMYATSTAAGRQTIDMRPNSTNGAYVTLSMDAGGGVSLVVSSAARITSAAGVITANTWHHVALCRSGTSTKLFVDGTQVGSTYTDSTNYLTTRLNIGRNSFVTTNDFSGYLDDIRITKGFARYPSAFTAPASAFLDYAAQASGTVLSQAGAPAARTVRAYRRDTGALVASTTSDGSGAYSINLPTADELTIVALDDQVSGTYYNDRVIRVIPA